MQERLVEVAQTAEVVVVAASRAGQLLRRRKPVGSEVPPEQPQQRPRGLLADGALAELLQYHEVVQVGAVVGGAAVLVDAPLIGVQGDLVQAAVASSAAFGLSRFSPNRIRLAAFISEMLV